jgi:hypothetical protein
MDRRERQLEERLAHLEIEVKMNREWNEIPESLKPTSKGRWEQMKGELKTQESRRLGWPKNY